MATNKLGDMLKEMRDPNLSQSRQDEIVRLLNEMGEREEKYKSWLQASGNVPKFPSIEVVSSPGWGVSPLHVLQVVNGGIAGVANNTTQVVTWSASLSANRGKAFLLDPSDTTKIRFIWRGWSFSVFGSAKWASNTTGTRDVRLEFFDVNDASLGAITPSSLPPVQTSTTVCPVADTVLDVPSIAYLKVSVIQTSGGALDLVSIRLGFFLI
jgi:hypothetical protein